jgi:hypothetical protein
VSLARLTKVDLRVDHAWQDMKPLAVDHLGRGRLPKPADFGDTAIGNANVADAFAIVIDHGAGF